MHIHKRVAIIVVSAAFFLTGALVVSAQSSEGQVNKIKRGLGIGASGKDVMLLQRFLSSDITIYPEGLITGFFGNLTHRAVRVFQERFGFEPVGNVGPKTLALINDFLARSDPMLLLATVAKTSSNFSAPTSLTANTLSDQSIRLQWQDSKNENGYSIERSGVVASGFQVIWTVGANTVSYINSGLTASTTYYYRIRALKLSRGNTTYSPYSNVASATTSSPPDITSPTVPTGVTATASSCSQVAISWSASTDVGGSGLQGYNVYHNSSLLTTIFAPTTSAIDSGLASSTTYTYTVSAFDQAGNPSAQSAPASITTPSCPVPQPTASISADSTSIVYNTGTTIRWGSTNTTSCSVSPSGWTGTSGAQSTGNLTATTTYALSCTGAGGSANASVAVSVGTPPTTATTTPPTATTTPPTALGTFQWAKRFFGTQGTRTYGTATDANGNIFATGRFYGPTDFGGGALPGTTSSTSVFSTQDVFVVKFSPAGVHLWSIAVTGVAYAEGEAIAVDKAGDVFVSGYFGGIANFGGVTFTAKGNSIFLAKYSGADGHLLWAKGFGGTAGSDIAYGVATDAQGDAYITGSFQAFPVDFGGIVLTPISGITGHYDVFLAKYSGVNGDLRWAKSFGSTDYDYAYGVAVDSVNNRVMMTGGSGQSINFAAPPPTAITTTATSQPTVFINADSISIASNTGTTIRWGSTNATSCSVSPSGWTGTSGARSTGNLTASTLYVLTCIGAGGSVASASITISVGGGASASGGATGYVASFSSIDGSYVWSKNFASGMGNAIATDASGNVFATGGFRLSTDFGCGPISSAGGTQFATLGVNDIFLARFDSSGICRWSRRFGGDSFELAKSVAYDPSGNVVISGYLFAGSGSPSDLGGGPIVAPYGAFVAKYSASGGGYLWSRLYGAEGVGSDEGDAVAVDSAGNSIIGGTISGPVDFGGGLTSASSPYLEAYLLKLSP